MVVVVCDALPVAYLLRRRIALSIFVPKILDADVIVEAMVVLRSSRVEWMVAVILGSTASTTLSGSSPMVLLQATTDAV
jgi:hypothetical protein